MFLLILEINRLHCNCNPRSRLTCLDRSSLQSWYRVMNFLANTRASMNPSATNIISQISSKSGTTIAHGLKRQARKDCRTSISWLQVLGAVDLWLYLPGLLQWARSHTAFPIARDRAPLPWLCIPRPRLVVQGWNYLQDSDASEFPKEMKSSLDIPKDNLCQSYNTGHKPWPALTWRELLNSQVAQFALHNQGSWWWKCLLRELS